MKAIELRNKSASELRASLSGLRREQFRLRLESASGEFVKTHKIKEIRKNIARHETLLAMKEGVK